MEEKPNQQTLDFCRKKLIKMRRIQMVPIILIVLYFVLFLLGPMHQVAAEHMPYLPMLIMVVVVVFAFQSSLAKCPRCNNAFSTRWYLLRPVTQKCVHCGLSLKEIEEMQASLNGKTDQNA